MKKKKFRKMLEKKHVESGRRMEVKIKKAKQYGTRVVTCNTYDTAVMLKIVGVLERGIEFFRMESGRELKWIDCKEIIIEHQLCILQLHYLAEKIYEKAGLEYHTLPAVKQILQQQKVNDEQ